MTPPGARPSRPSAGWSGYLWKDGALWKGGPVLRDDGTPRALRDPQHAINRTLKGETTLPSRPPPSGAARMAPGAASPIIWPAPYGAQGASCRS